MQISTNFCNGGDGNNPKANLIPWKKNHIRNEKLCRTVVAKAIIYVLRLYVHFLLSSGCH